ncbi:MAG: hypothetical protein BroJett040_03080 [Oligoflexia bacterium]|nr:MAG: hypothetical protein BroJett040_03080 [Oligoflexia bacterium]
MIFDRIENLPKYFSSGLWEQAYQFALQSLKDPQIQNGEVKIAGEDLFARINSYPTKSEDLCIVEAHVQYIDIHFMIEGEEIVFIHPKSELKAKTEYDQASDYTFYEAPKDYALSFKLTPGHFAVIFPDEAHKTQVQAGQCPAQNKKIVFKLKI